MKGGLTSLGKDLVRLLNTHKVFVDLAHASRETFFDALSVHDKSQPLLVSHTGVNAVHRIWRNIDDDQIKAIADTGGVVGILFEKSFIGPNANVEGIVDHIEHVIRVTGEDHVALGSDFDGFIRPPRDLVEPYYIPRLVEEMLIRGWKEGRIGKVLGGNFLRALKLLRGL